MDFLDPLKRRKHRKRLILTYVLMAIVTVIGTVLLVYAAYGYGINPKTGDIVKHGLVFVDSKPVDAAIYVDGQPVDKRTSARLALPVKKYQISLKRDGYHAWQNSFVLKEQSLIRYNYPLMVPLNPKAASLKSYGQLPLLASQTPDQRLLLIGGPTTGNGRATIDVYRLDELPKPPTPLPLPASLLSPPGVAGGHLAAVQWDNDGRHLLLKHYYQNTKEYILLDRVSPARSVNVNRLFGVNPSSVSLRGQDSDELLLFDKASGNLRLANTVNGQLSRPLFTGAEQFKAVNAQSIIYNIRESKTGQRQVKLWDGDASYDLASLPGAGRLFLDGGRYQNSSYYTVGASTSKWLAVYKDPLDSLRSPAGQATPSLSLKLPALAGLSMSPEGRFLLARSAKSAAVVDLELSQTHQFQLPRPAGGLYWLDGYHYVSPVGGRAYIIDYDGRNRRPLAPSLLPTGAFLSRNKEVLVTAVKSGDGSVALNAVSLAPAAR